MHVQVVEHLIEVVLVADTLSCMPAYSRCSYDEVTGRIATSEDADDVRSILDVMMIEYMKENTLSLPYHPQPALTALTACPKVGSMMMMMMMK